MSIQNPCDHALKILARTTQPSFYRPICEQIQSSGLWGDFYAFSALVAFHPHEYQKANQLLQQALLLRQKMGTFSHIMELLETTIQIVVGQHKLKQGPVLAAAVVAYRQQHNLVAPPAEKKLVDEALAVACQHLPSDTAATAWATGATMTLDEAVTYALTENHAFDAQ